jgi:hypothetical protein
MTDDPLLTKDELAFIHKVQQEPLRTPHLAMPSFRIDGGTSANAALSRLATQAKLTLEADFNGQRISFPLHLIEDEFHALHLELGAPGIFEDGAVSRSWRLPLEQPLTLLEEDGTPSPLSVHELSPSGVLLEMRGRKAPPKRFLLWLPIPGQEPLPLRGTLVRKTGDRLLAYRLEMCHHSHSERLRQFIFDQHRKLHPRLHSVTDLV